MLRKKIITGLAIALVLVTGFWLYRISANEDIVESYEAKQLPSRSKIGALDKFWQSYTGGTRRAPVNFREAQAAREGISSAYRWMFFMDAAILVAAGVVFFKVKK